VSEPAAEAVAEPSRVDADPTPDPEPGDMSPEEFTGEHRAITVEPGPAAPPPQPLPPPGFSFVARPDRDLDVDPALAAALAPQRLPNGVRVGEAGVAEEDPAELMCALPGVVVGPTLARGIGEAVARARLRRRRRRRAGPPSAGLHRYDPFSGELTRRIEWFALARRQDGNGAATEARLELGTLPIGERNREEVALSLVRSGGLCLVGARAREAARAIVLTFLAEHDPDTGRAIVVGDLLPSATTFPGLGRTREVGAVLGGLQAEISRRRTLLTEAGADDVVAFQAARPSESLPLILVAAAEMTPFESQRLRTLLVEGGPAGIVGLVVDTSLEDLLALELHGPGRVAAQSGRTEAPDLTGTRLFTVEREPAAELLEVLASARSDVDSEPSIRTDASFQVTPAPSPAVSVKILGGYRIDAHAKEIRSGLRAKAKELLAFYLLHPEGTTLEEATEALWPEADARRGSEWFWTALGNLRSRLRSATENRDLKVIERHGDRYRIEPVFDVDLWRFEAALAHAGANSGDPGWIEALQAAADLYTGELLAGFDWPWAEVPREDLRGRAVDVLVSIAATRLVGGDARGALDALERAVEVDPLAEQLYRRIMRLHAKLARPDQADATFRALQARLGEIALEPTPESEKLHGELCGTG
jgi:DNA-binding SARP family transcriptional activator